LIGVFAAFVARLTHAPRQASQVRTTPAGTRHPKRRPF
jgi:hypothetical protein